MTRSIDQADRETITWALLLSHLCIFRGEAIRLQVNQSQNHILNHNSQIMVYFLRNVCIQGNSRKRIESYFAQHSSLIAILRLVGYRTFFLPSLKFFVRLLYQLCYCYNCDLSSLSDSLLVVIFNIFRQLLSSYIIMCTLFFFAFSKAY